MGFSKTAGVVNKGAPLQAETTALLARMTVQPSNERKNNINRLIATLKNKGVWAKLDCLYLCAAHDAQAAQRNWIQDAYNITPTAVPTFAVDSGYSTNGTTSWLDTGFNPTLAVTPNFTQNSASFGGMRYQVNGGAALMGGLFDGTQGTTLIPRLVADDTFNARINQVTATNTTPTVVGDGSGLFAVDRNASNSSKFYANGVPIFAGGAVSSALVNGTFGYGRLGSSSTLFYTTTTIAGFIGGSLTDLQHYELNAALLAYVSSFNSVTISPTFTSTDQTYIGGYIELQPDSYNGGTSIPPTDSTTDIWGFPYSLDTGEQARLRALLFAGGGKGLKYVRFPLGFAYRGLRNIDGTSGLARNIGERFSGQNSAITNLLSTIVPQGGGLAVEYWGIPPHWTTNSKFGGSNGVQNTLWAGAAYARATTLDSIRTTDAAQYAAQISALTDAMLNDYEYVHQNVAPIRMYGLQNEPQAGNVEYGTCLYTNQVYTDVLSSLEPKVAASNILGSYGGSANTPLLYVASSENFTIGQSYITANPTKIWSYTHHNIKAVYKDADALIGILSSIRAGKSSCWINEAESFEVNASGEFRCANNMLRQCHDFVYGSAPCTMPVIHAAKQLNAAGANSNTTGYALTRTRLPAPFGQSPLTVNDPFPNVDYQKFEVVPDNFNSHMFFGDNLPIGAVRVGATPTLPTGVGLAAFTFAGKLYLFLVNRNKSSVHLSIALTGSKTLVGKRYSINFVGKPLPSRTEATLKVTLPAYTGEVWIEQ